MDEEPIPLSQLANDAFNPVVDFSNEGQPLATGAGAPIDYSGLVASLTNGSNGTDEAGPGCSGVAGPGPGSIQETGRYTKSGKLFQVEGGGGGEVGGWKLCVDFWLLPGSCAAVRVISKADRGPSITAGQPPAPQQSPHTGAGPHSWLVPTGSCCSPHF